MVAIGFLICAVLSQHYRLSPVFSWRVPIAIFSLIIYVSLTIFSIDHGVSYLYWVQPHIAILMFALGWSGVTFVVGAQNAKMIAHGENLKVRHTRLKAEKTNPDFQRPEVDHAGMIKNVWKFVTSSEVQPSEIFD